MEDSAERNSTSLRASLNLGIRRARTKPPLVVLSDHFFQGEAGPARDLFGVEGLRESGLGGLFVFAKGLEELAVEFFGFRLLFGLALDGRHRTDFEPVEILFVDLGGLVNEPVAPLRYDVFNHEAFVSDTNQAWLSHLLLFYFNSSTASNWGLGFGFWFFWVLVLGLGFGFCLCLFCLG